MRRLIAALGVLPPLLAPATSAAQALVSGAYDDAMLIAYDPATHLVSGYFDMEQGGEPSFSCIFYLQGRLNGSSASIRTYYPATPKDDLIVGQLSVQSTKSFRVRLPSEHGGCWNVEHFADKDQPAVFTLATSYPWTSVVVVKSPKAYLYASPASPAHGKAYIVQGDGVGVRATQPGWLRVDFVGGKRPISGWLRQADVYPVR